MARGFLFPVAIDDLTPLLDEPEEQLPSRTDPRPARGRASSAAASSSVPVIVSLGRVVGMG